MKYAVRVSGPVGVTGRTASVIFCIIIVTCPFKDIPGHIQCPERAGAGWITTYLACILIRIVEISACVIRRIFAPGIGVDRIAASGIFPFCFGGQAAAGPFTILLGGIPGYVDHWKVIKLSVVEIGRVRL